MQFISGIKFRVLLAYENRKKLDFSLQPRPCNGPVESKPRDEGERVGRTGWNHREAHTDHFGRARSSRLHLGDKKWSTQYLQSKSKSKISPSFRIK